MPILTEQEMQWNQIAAEQARKNREAIGPRKPVAPTLATQAPQQTAFPATPVPRLWGAAPMPQGLPRPRVEGLNAMERFADWAGIRQTAQSPAVVPPATNVPAPTPVISQPSLATTQTQPMTDTPEQTNTVTMAPQPGSPGYSRRLQPGQYVAYGTNPASVGEGRTPGYVPNTLTTNLSLRGPARTTAYLNRIDRPTVQEPSLLTAEQQPRRYNLGVNPAYENKLKQTRIAMGVGGTVGLTPDEQKAILNKRWDMTRNTSERKGIERSLADIATKEAQASSLAMQEAGWKRGDMLAKQAQENALAQIKAKGEAQAGIYGAKKAAQTEGELTAGEKVEPFVAAGDLLKTKDAEGKNLVSADQKKVFNDQRLKGLSIADAAKTANIEMNIQPEGYQAAIETPGSAFMSEKEMNEQQAKLTAQQLEMKKNRRLAQQTGKPATIDKNVVAQGTVSQAGQTATVQPGTVDSGFRFKGGDPKDRANWEKI